MTCAKMVRVGLYVAIASAMASAATAQAPPLEYATSLSVAADLLVNFDVASLITVSDVPSIIPAGDIAPTLTISPVQRVTIEASDHVPVAVSGLGAVLVPDGDFFADHQPMVVSSGGEIRLEMVNAYSGQTRISSDCVVSAAGLDIPTVGATNLVIEASTLKYVGGVTSTGLLTTIGTAGATIDASGSGVLTFSNIAVLRDPLGGTPELADEQAAEYGAIGVPEPTGIVLVCLATVGILGFRRRLRVGAE